MVQSKGWSLNRMVFSSGVSLLCTESSGVAEVFLQGFHCSALSLLVLQKRLLWEFMSCKKLKNLQLDEPNKIGYTYKSMGSGFWALKQDDFRKAIQKITMEARYKGGGEI